MSYRIEGACKDLHGGINCSSLMAEVRALARQARFEGFDPCSRSGSRVGGHGQGTCANSSEAAASEPFGSAIFFAPHHHRFSSPLFLGHIHFCSCSHLENLNSPRRSPDPSSFGKQQDQETNWSERCTVSYTLYTRGSPIMLGTGLYGTIMTADVESKPFWTVRGPSYV